MSNFPYDKLTEQMLFNWHKSCRKKIKEMTYAIADAEKTIDEIEKELKVRWKERIFSKNK